MASQTTTTKEQSKKSKYRAKGKKPYTLPAKKQPGEVPILHLHKGSQFHVFLDAISKAAMRMREDV